MTQQTNSNVSPEAALDIIQIDEKPPMTELCCCLPTQSPTDL